MRKLILYLTLISTTPSALPQQGSLTPDEKHRLLRQLNGYEACLAGNAELKALREREAAMDERERAQAARDLEIERKATALANERGDLYKQQMEFYRTALESVTRGPSAWCRVKKIFTLGLARCR